MASIFLSSTYTIVLVLFFTSVSIGISGTSYNILDVLGVGVQLVQSPMTTTIISITNAGVQTIKYSSNKDWSGTVLGNYPQTIQLYQNGGFSHSGMYPNDQNGSIGAVVFVGPNKQTGSDDCAWVLAWSNPGQGDNKVYVETGPSNKYIPGAVGWPIIQSKLQNSSASSSAYDSTCQSQASAVITKKNDNLATVDATFFAA
ncbi:unnamed protein product [Amaranthus hypochondriacus]